MRQQPAVGVHAGGVAAAIFLVAYDLFGDLLLDKNAITAKINRQFSVSAATVLLIAPITILLNSFVEEFFYRGFAFGLLAAKRPWLGALLPAIVFTVQHLLFIYHWVSALPLLLAIVGLMVFAPGAGGRVRQGRHADRSLGDPRLRRHRHDADRGGAGVQGRRRRSREVSKASRRWLR